MFPYMNDELDNPLKRYLIRSEIILASSFTPSDDKDVTRIESCADKLIP